MTGTGISTKPILFLGGHEGFGPPPPAVREIVFASDLSPASDRAFDHARLLAEGFGAHLVLYHVLEGGLADAGPREAEVNHRVERAAREHLERRAQRAGVPTDIRVERAASAWPSLTAFLLEARPDLLVMGTHGRKGVAHFILGSVAEQVLQHTRIPTLCVREPEHGVARPYRRILVPTDLSPASRRAFPMAAAFARAFGAEILALHVADVRVRGATWGITAAMEDRVPS
jgi:nucleotide-binding universal stress UspA family protein